MTRQSAIAFLHDHPGLISLNPLVTAHSPIAPPAHAAADEEQCAWYSVTDRISFVPGVKAASGTVSYTSAFLDLPSGVQTHSYAPLGVDLRSRWTICGNEAGEKPQPVELGLVDAPRSGLYLREDTDLRCSFAVAAFVKKTLKKAHGTLVDALVARSSSSSSSGGGGGNSKGGGAEGDGDARTTLVETPAWAWRRDGDDGTTTTNTVMPAGRNGCGYASSNGEEGMNCARAGADDERATLNREEERVLGAENGYAPAGGAGNYPRNAHAPRASGNRPPQLELSSACRHDASSGQIPKLGYDGRRRLESETRWPSSCSTETAMGGGQPARYAGRTSYTRSAELP